ncbi:MULTISPECIES: type II secretion system F family protein [unclassified Methylophilus]|uniref:type II secretion system F family protein n=1 Tax=unclassified Methylophilus TaxID=2630143 RepID=UPI0006FB37B0|nr:MULTISPECIES: type II secretion system F family protein [unclassified Methylophilus]KQT41841.1 type II secretion system protein [Methylophilus sp. Leaf416]KQT56006.1 type II secretion system protein [Methylophilus sp. Leaf459]
MRYQAKVLNGSLLTMVELQADDEQDAYAQLKSKGLLPVSLQLDKSGKTRLKKEAFPLALFSQELLALLHSGLNLVEAIEALSLRQDHTRAVLQGILQSLQQGKSFSAALERQPEVFPPLYFATVKAAERTGDLGNALSRYIAYDNQVSLLKKKIISASIYPMLLIIVGGLVIAFLMGFVVPKFSSVYEGTGADLPWMSQMMLQWGTLISQHGETMLAILVGGIIGLILVFKTPSMRQAMVRAIWRIPAVGAKLQLYQLARFYRTLGMLLAGGTPIMTAIDSLGGLLDISMALSLQQAQTMISQGQPLSNAFKTAGMTTPIGERMLLVGERGGNVAQMMDSIAGFYDEELARWIDWFTKLFEPLLMLFIGLVIGVVVLLLYMPIFELAGQIQ